MKFKCIWFTGLSGSGKSTTANALRDALLEMGYAVVLLDGDEVRSRLCRDLGYSREDRHTNVQRVAAVAKDAVQNGAIVVCALISPYQASRDLARKLVGPDNFMEVFVDVPLHVCEGRDVRGLYARARKGEIRQFTGLDDPYERPTAPELTIDGANQSVSHNVELILQALKPGGPCEDIACE